MKFVFVGFDFILVLTLGLLFLIIDHDVLIRNKSYFGVDHDEFELESCKGLGMIMFMQA